jgi:2-methylcitrate dehydratase
MIPAVLAVAEPRRVGGQEVIRAIFAEYEVVAALRRGGFHALRKRHVDQVQSVLGSAVGAGMILGLDVDQMANALSLAITPNIPLRVVRTGVLSDWKGCATAQGAMMGVFAARLAHEGLTGPPEPFAGIAGFYDLLRMDPLNLDSVGLPRNGLSAIEATGFKYYPTEYSSQGPLGMLLDLRQRIDVKQIKQVNIALHWGGWHEIGGGQGDREEKWNPTTRETADHSLPYLAAIALFDGEISLESFTEERFTDPVIRSFMQKIDVVEDPELTQLHAGELPRWPSSVEIILNNGEKIQQVSQCPKGHPLHPMSDDELEAKFLVMSEPVMPGHQARRLLDTLWSLEALDDINRLTEQFRYISHGD